MKSGLKRFVFLLLVPAAFAFGIFFFARSQRAPSETEMLANLKTHKRELNQLVQMARSDHLFFMNGDTGTANKRIKANNFQEVDISKSRLMQYKTLMEKVGVQNFSCSFDNSACHAGVFGGGFADTTWSVGYAWELKPDPSMKIVPSAYYDQIKMRDTTVYSKIESHWFIYRSR
jgi:hypothetical protein